jgi:LPS-assembly lipoprotein
MFLAGCGFRPLHNVAQDSGTSPPESLAATRIQPLEGRVGQDLHNLLRDRLNPSGQPSKPAYLLEVELRKSTTELAIRKDETATRANLTMSADYKLRDFETKAVLLNSRSVSVNSYNILDALYATTVAEDDAVKRGLRELADEIRLRLAIYFAGPHAANRP